MTSARSERTIHVWSVALGARDAPLEPVVLSADERARAERFRFERDRCRYVTAHVSLRRIVADAVGTSPDRIVFGARQNGKPFIASPETSIQFNLSHADDVALIAVADNRPVGVDIERVVSIEHDLIAAHFFSSAEADQLRSVREADKAVAFANCWTRKEAYLKATGAGVTHGLDHFDVTLLPGEPAQLLADRRDPAASRWRMQALHVPPGYAAALVAEGVDWDVEQREFS